MPGPRRNMGPKQKIDHPFRIAGKIIKFMGKHYAIHLIIVLICIVTSVLANVQGTWFMKALVDEYILPMIKNGTNDFTPLLNAMARVAIFYGIGVVATFAQSEIMVFVTQGTLKDLRIEMFKHMESLPIKYFDTHAHGDIMSMYTNDIDTLRQMVSQSMPQIINSVITIVSVFIAMLTLSVPLTIVTILMIVVMMLVSKKLTSLSGRFFLAQQKDIGKVNGYIEEMMEGQKVVKVFCHEEQAMEEFNELNDKLYHSANNANKFANVMAPCNGQLGNLSYVLCACVGAVLAINGVMGFSLTPGALISFLTYNKQFAQPINQVTMQMNSIVMALAGADRIFKLLDEKPEVDDGYVTLVRCKKENGEIVECSQRTGMWAWKHFHKDDGTTTYVEMKGEVVFDGVDFGYNDDKIVLHDVKLYANPGQKLAFVGSTGAGKQQLQT